jgi:hypothetical protein
MTTTTAYINEGATLTATLDAQGTVVPANTKRIIKSAALVNTTAAPVVCSVSIVDAAAGIHPKVSARTLAVNETYHCPELIGKGINAGGVVKASGLGVSFDYTATDIV